MNRRWGLFAVIWLLILATIYIGDRFIRDVLLTDDAPRAVTPRGDLARFRAVDGDAVRGGLALGRLHLHREPGEPGQRRRVRPGLGPRRPCRHQLPRRPGRGFRAGEARRRRGGAGGDDRHRAGLRPGRGPAARDAGTDPADPDRHLGRPQGRAVGFRHRQPVRALAHADDRRDQRAQPPPADLQRPRGARGDPDRRGDQSRQFGRPAARFRRPADRGQHGDPVGYGRVVGHRLRGPGRHRQPHRAAPDPRRRGAEAPASASW